MGKLNAESEVVGLSRRAEEATVRGGVAYERLLRVAESSRAGQAGIVAEFIASTVGYVRFDLYDLRALDIELSDDVLSCLDAIRWGRTHICALVSDGAVRANAVSSDWGYSSADLSATTMALQGKNSPNHAELLREWLSKA